MRLSSVDLPQPEAPSRQTNSPGAMSGRCRRARAVRAEALADALDAHGGGAARRAAGRARSRRSSAPEVGHARSRRHRRGDAGSCVRACHVSPRRARRPRPASASVGLEQDPLSRRRSNSPSIEPSFCVPAVEAVLDERLEGVGVRVDREGHVLERARDDLVGERLAGLRLDARVDHGRRLVGVVGDPLDGRDVALEQRLRPSRGARRGSRPARAARWSGTRRPPTGRPRRRARARRRRRSGATPTARAARRRRAAPCWNSVRVCAFSVGVMCTSPPPVVSVVVALVGEPGCAARRPACCRAAGWRASCPRGRRPSRCRRARRAPRRRWPRRR